jgi:hypothetical protein
MKIKKEKSDGAAQQTLSDFMLLGTQPLLPFF